MSMSVTVQNSNESMFDHHWEGLPVTATSLVADCDSSDFTGAAGESILVVSIGISGLGTSLKSSLESYLLVPDLE